MKLKKYILPTLIGAIIGILPLIYFNMIKGYPLPSLMDLGYLFGASFVFTFGIFKLYFSGEGKEKSKENTEVEHSDKEANVQNNNE